ncbi:hypothetical protein C7974DRAFT_466359 [Boeremia exigua]|uniref:uncharacterized protein n=1 Tax=Boeremia exigua TaxID=749465 RepID=UPI001E8D58F2|nr:uncharacterized protein C7974DRAFT_466359 [Boeremia exigua]KAH6613836.1 hypothetical protein C7974DRAFT_466359 [Boeremia exigua]
MGFSAVPRHPREDEKAHPSTEFANRCPLKWLLIGLCASNFVFLMATIISGLRLYSAGGCIDPLLTPANNAIEYHEKHFEAALANYTEYMGFPDDEIDKRWSDLYDFGISVASEEEAKQLPHPTIPIPGTTEYLFELDVWHSLHCLNDLRKLLYPERFQLLQRLTKDGKIDRNSFAFRHWDHCVDTLRQSLMCQSDVAPLPFHVNIPFNRGIFPRLTTTHTCRNFTKVQEWAKEHRAPNFEFMISDPAELQKIIDDSGFDHSPEENMEGLYMMFPGNKFFQHWRDHPVEKV